MKKTLIICGHYPSPENIGTTMRTMNFVNFFRTQGAVDIAYSTILPGGRTGNPAFSLEYPLNRRKETTFWDRLMRWTEVGKRPFPIARLDDMSEEKLFSLLERKNYDYLLVRYVINTWPFFQKSELRERTIVDFDDILSGSLYESDISKVDSALRRIRLRLNLKYLKEYEKRCLQFGASLFCSEKDRQTVVGENLTKNAFVIPNIYQDTSFEGFDFGDGAVQGPTLLFVGMLQYAPNVQGLSWFVQEIFPSFKEKYPDAEMLVVGRSPDSAVRKICAGRPDITLFADVPDIKGYYARCRAVVVPLLAGGGTRIKILEAACAGRPVLTTPVGAEGLDLRNGSELFYFEGPEEFIRQYARLQEKEVYSSLVAGARNKVKSGYSADAFGESMERVLKHIDDQSLRQDSAWKTSATLISPDSEIF